MYRLLLVENMSSLLGQVFSLIGLATRGFGPEAASRQERLKETVHVYLLTM